MAEPNSIERELAILEGFTIGFLEVISGSTPGHREREIAWQAWRDVTREALEQRDRKWRALLQAEAEYTAAIHERVNSRYGSERRQRTLDAAKYRKDTLAAELGAK